MKNLLQKITLIALLLFVFQITLTAQPIGSQIKIGTDSHISYWDGVSAWIPVVTLGLPGQSLQFAAGVPTWVNNPNGITTTSVTNIIGTTAISGGNILSDGGATITARGVCWSTSPNPTIADAHTTDGIGIGSFTSNLSGLSAGTTYYVRAYATNSAGTAYGNEVTFTFLTIGNSYQGGIIAYILQPSDPGYVAGETHGIIATPNDLSSGIQWNNGSSTEIGASGTAIGTGNANTNAIVASQGAGSYAAKLCYDLILSGYSDWYLPSIEELSKLYQNRGAIGGFNNNGRYWSSTEFNFTNTFNLDCINGTYYTDYKSYTFFVRAIRAF